MNSGRRQSVDFLRGLAILAMVAYHATWDLNYYRIIEVGIGVDPLWFTIQRAILTAFLLLVGAGLWLGHRNGINWRGFWKREALVVAAALGVSVVTWFQFGEYFAYFGVLHAIALSSLLALPFVRAPVGLTIVVALVVLLLPAVWSSELFNTRWLAWIGFFTAVPETADLVPMFPWFGVVLLGLAGMRLFADLPVFNWTSRALPVRGLVAIGRWSLVIYLVHQPLLFGAIGPLAGWLDRQQAAKFAQFTQSCEASCGANEDAGFCVRYCQCALEMTVRDDLWNADPVEVAPMTTLCTALSR
ncbi:MAG TPA: heparan-alpha-glucosaminide N-acetyltransferase [Devosia sp.]|jgi:uncharacterized membrane protein|nr:heparan-alpha-glucosaminide N-acetyltransferase [Devosia sp.]